MEHKRFSLRDIGVEQPLPVAADGTISGEMPTKYLKFTSFGDYVCGLVREPLITTLNGQSKSEWPVRLDDGRVKFFPDNSHLVGQLMRIRNQVQGDFYVRVVYVGDRPSRKANPQKLYHVTADPRKPVPPPSDQGDLFDLQVPA